ncbi:MAG: InlB B-repeat-containing protein, partial [Butyrivibrio sp.]|nr:InlB B-repeat-containing protein [Butyrivibrio sp.]
MRKSSDRFIFKLGKIQTRVMSSILAFVVMFTSTGFTGIAGEENTVAIDASTLESSIEDTSGDGEIESEAGTESATDESGSGSGSDENLQSSTGEEIIEEATGDNSENSGTEAPGNEDGNTAGDAEETIDNIADANDTADGTEEPVADEQSVSGTTESEQSQSDNSEAQEENVTEKVTEESTGSEETQAQDASQDETSENSTAEETVVLVYDANGGSGSMDNVSAAVGATITVSSCKLTYDGYSFISWNTESDGTGTEYTEGSQITMPEGGITLYAQWEEEEEELGLVGLFGSTSSDYPQYVLYVNGDELPKGDSDGWYEVSYDASVAFSAKVITSETESADYDSDVEVIYASSVSELSGSGISWEGMPDVGEYYLYFNVPGEDVILTPDEINSYNFKLKITDSIAPVITGYDISGDNLSIKANDGSGSGISSYALSTSDSASGVSASEWTTVPSAPVKGDAGISLSKDYSELDAGIYYLYVKDASGNTARSDASISVTKVVLNKYYENETLTEYVKYIARSGSDTPNVKLPSTSRSKFTFGGYYDNENYSGEAVNADTSVDLQAGADNNYYAKWTLTGVSFTTDLSAEYTKTYDGTSIDLSVELADSDSYSSVNWTWYRSETETGTYSAVEGGANGTLSVKNVSDSGYYKAVASITEGNDTYETESSVAHVVIDKRPLSLTIDNQTIVYRSAAPSYTISAQTPDSTTGLTGGDTLESVLGAEYSNKLSCAYSNDGGTNSNVGEYPITAEGLSVDNYELTVTSGTLTVTALTVDENVRVNVTLTPDETSETESYTYTGSAIEPQVSAVTLTANDSTIELTSDDYEVSYENNVNVGSSAKVIITFKGNFSGTFSGKTFAITTASYSSQTTISSTSWKYGETPDNLSVGVSDIRENASVTYYYLAKGSEENFDAADKSGATQVMPTNAGTYYVWGVISATTNYTEMIAEPVVFEISKRQITLTSDTASWPYDGNTHTSGNYTEDGDGFAEGQGFHSVTVSGSVTTVAEGSVTNDIQYVLTSATDASNYDIIVNKGTLSITKAPLPQITSLKWSSSTVGRLEWVAITRDGLNIEYKVQLYRDGATLGDPITTSDTYYDVKDIILADTVSNKSAAAYSATITAVIIEDAAGMYNNYAEGTASEMISEKYTAKLTLTKAGGDEGIASILFTTNVLNGEDEDDTVTYLLQGQSVRADVSFNTGYENDDDGSVFNYTTGSAGLSKGAYSSNGYYTVYFSNSQLTSKVDASLVVKSADSAPVCESYSGSQASDYSYVQADISISDALGLAGYKLVKVDAGTSITDENWSTYITDDNWTEIPYISGRPATSCTTSMQLTEKGNYYLAFKDIGGNIRYSGTPITVYEISFDKNDDAATGEMSTIFKLKDSTVVIPANTFKKAGYAFTNWTAGSSILPDGASYVKNESVTLKAGWTNKKYNYKVNYYYQKFSLNEDGTVVTDDDGNVVLSYELDSDSTATFSCSYNTTVSYDAAAIQLEKAGYELTQTPALGDGISYESSITVSEDDMELNVYYNLLSYTMTYTYTDYDKSTQSHVDTFYYGQPFTEYAKPTHTGYSFIGWNYGDAGSAPSTMPAS